MKTKQISDYHPLPPIHYLPLLALLMEKCYVSVCFFPKPRFQEMVENEKLTYIHTRMCACLQERSLLLSFFNYTKFLLLAELLFLFLKPYHLSQKWGKFQDWFVGKKKDPFPPSDQNHLKWFHCIMQTLLPLRSPYCKEGLNTSPKQKNKLNLGTMNRRTKFKFLFCIWWLYTIDGCV